MSEQELFDHVAQELRSGQVNDGLWTRAFAEAGGLRDLAQANYIRLRVSQLIELDETKTRLAEQVRDTENEHRVRDARRAVAFEVLRNLCWILAIAAVVLAHGMFTRTEGFLAIITLLSSVGLALAGQSASKKSTEIKKMRRK